MSELDETGRWDSVDPSGMRTLIESFPDQIRRASEIASAIELPRHRSTIAHVVVTGLGGSAIGGDVVRAAVADTVAVPFWVSRDYVLPAFVGGRTLVVASSYSGNTEETLSAYEVARAADAKIVCITSGGEIAARARDHGVPVITIPGGLPPRAALGFSSVALLGVLAALRLAPGIREALAELQDVVEALAGRYAAAVAEDHNRAKRLARTCHGKIVAIYGSAGVLEPAAVRWRGQMEENAKNLAFHHLLPEMNHNELEGWNHPQETLRRIAAVLVRDHADHPQVQRRFDLTRELLERAAGAVEEVWSEGDSRLARIFSVAYLGDFVSLYLAYLNGVDPTPVPAIDSVKDRLRDVGH